MYGKKLFVNLEISQVDKDKFTKLPCQKIVDPTLSGTTYLLLFQVLYQLLSKLIVANDQTSIADLSDFLPKEL